MTTVISVENLSKSYRLGQIGTGTLSRDLQIWWAKKRGKPNPLLKIGQTDHGHRDGEELWALRDLSFTVQQGEVLGIIGRNGAGKSTLLKILSRVTAPTGGCVKVKGRIASLLEVGTGFHPELTGRENIYLNGAILGMSREEVRRKFDEIVAFAEVEKFIDTPVKRYSSGMYVRLAFAVAAHLESEILLVDEVLAVGDAEFQKKCLGKMGDVASNEGRTVLFVSHNMAAVEHLCKNGILLDRGSMLHRASINNVISKYLGQASTLQKKIILDDKDNSIPVLNNVCIINKDNELTNNILMGEPFSIQVEFSSNYPLVNPGLGIRINTPFGLTIIGCTNEMYPSKKLKNSSESKNGKFIVKFNNPNLNQGDFTISLTFSDSGRTIKKYPDVINLKIVPKALFNSAKIPTTNQSLIITDIEYAIEMY